MELCMFATLLREGRICDRRTKTYPITSTVGIARLGLLNAGDLIPSDPLSGSHIGYNSVRRTNERA